MKKILALLLAMIMCFGILAACAGDGDTPAPPPPPAPPGTDGGSEGTGSDPAPSDSERAQLAAQYGLPYDASMDAWEPISFTYFNRNPNTEPAAGNLFLETVKEITNVEIVFQFLVGDLDTAFGVMMAGGDVADFAFFGGADYTSAAIDSGHFMPIDELMEQHAPRLRAHYDPWWGLMRHVDGRIYTAEIYGTPVGAQTEQWANGTAFWLQKDIVDHFGRAPADLDEYFDFIREYKDINPTIDGVPTIGFAIESFGWQNFGVVNSGYFLAGNANWGGAVNTGGEVLFSMMLQDNQSSFLQFLYLLLKYLHVSSTHLHCFDLTLSLYKFYSYLSLSFPVVFWFFCGLIVVYHFQFCTCHAC